MADQSEPAAKTPRANGASALTGREPIDPAILASEEAAPETTDADLPRAPAPARTNAVPQAETAVPQAIAPTKTPPDINVASDADPSVQGKRAQATVLPGAVNAEQMQDAKVKLDPSAQATPKADAVIDASIDTVTKSVKSGADVAAQFPTPGATAEASDDALRIIRQQDGVELPPQGGKLAELASEADLTASTVKSALSASGADAKAPTAALPDALISIAQPTATSAPAVTSGLTPVAPSVPIAAPSELNAIILNAVKNGGEPREQLIVQLDPPELGRVAIDFKFDAQGVQQITVTSENPEALRRLRELHFELTEALKDHGLSEQNLTFRQQADDQSQPSWQMPERNGSGTLFSANEEPPAESPLLRSNSAYTQPDRLDLTL
ncbi:MAG: flagellar hook-length control protein FliK [Hyphomonadaceae bacterium]|nr:flagellar hook-length control protein FliK [Hyphomonadaceae bacterium]